MGDHGFEHPSLPLRGVFLLALCHIDARTYKWDNVSTVGKGPAGNEGNNMCLWIMTERGWRPWHASNRPCPNSNDLQGVFRPQTKEEAEAEVAKRIPRFLEANGIQNLMLKQQYFSGNSFIEPISGPFGEKL